MNHLPCSILLTLLLVSCAGNNFDEATIPTDQLNTELAFKRVADHGGMEAVLEENQEFTDWQFHIASKSKTSLAGGKPVYVFHLNDRSGVEYKISSASTPASIIDQLDLGYGYASGKVLSVERDLVAGEFNAELSLNSWRER